MLTVGQGVLGKVRFVDGSMPDYDRPYLVVSASGTSIGLLNVSSAKGKEHKILYPTNKLLRNHFPPFKNPSFVKMDSYVSISADDAKSLCVIANGQPLDSGELVNILAELFKNK